MCQKRDVHNNKNTIWNPFHENNVIKINSTLSINNSVIYSEESVNKWTFRTFKIVALFEIACIWFIEFDWANVSDLARELVGFIADKINRLNRNSLTLIHWNELWTFLLYGPFEASTWNCFTPCIHTANNIHIHDIFVTKKDFPVFCSGKYLHQI